MSRWFIHPALGNIVVRPQEEEERTASGLWLVAPAIEQETHIAEVVAVCDPYDAAISDRSISRAGPIYQLGDLVIIGKYNGRDIKIRDSRTEPVERFIIIRESDVLGLLKHREEEDASNNAGSSGGGDALDTAEGIDLDASGRSRNGS